MFNPFTGCFQLKTKSRLIEEQIVLLRSTSQQDKEVIDKLRSEIFNLRSERDNLRVALVTLQLECCALKRDKENYEEFSKAMWSLAKKSEFCFSIGQFI